MIDEPNPYKPMLDIDWQVKYFAAPARPWRLIAFTAFVASGLFAIFAFTTAYLYAKSHDPWLTPRMTYYMTIWHGIGRPMLDVMTFLVPIGLFMLPFQWSKSQRLMIVFLVAIMISLPFFLGIP